MATGGGNAFPIIRHAKVFLIPKSQLSGKPCNLANIRGVSRGIPLNFAHGASLAIAAYECWSNFTRFMSPFFGIFPTIC